MKKIIIFLAFFATSQSFAQNVNPKNQPNSTNPSVARETFKQTADNKIAPSAQSAIPPKLTPEEKAIMEKNIADQKEFLNALKNFKPAQQKKYNESNQYFSLKMVEYNTKLIQEIEKISKIKNLMVIQTYIFKGKLDINPIRSKSASQQDFFKKQISEYEALPQDKKILIKKEIIKFRKNVNALEKKRRQELKLLFKKDFNNFKERETEEEIKIDDK